MAKLFHDIVFGPIKSRRFGVSLGINTLPLESKICNFNCIYCECGWTDLKNNHESFFNESIIIQNIKDKFTDLAKQKIKLDAITFAGNGEPTMHPRFKEIIASVKLNRDIYLPGVPIIVLTNGFLLDNKNVVEGLHFADQCIMKLDAGTDELLQAIDQPIKRKNIDWYVSKLLQLNIPLKIQTMFLKGTHNGKNVDNTSEGELSAWIKLLKKINPVEVMIYTIDRTPPSTTITKLTNDELLKIKAFALKEGINAQMYL